MNDKIPPSGSMKRRRFPLIQCTVTVHWLVPDTEHRTYNPLLLYCATWCNRGSLLGSIVFVLFLFLYVRIKIVNIFCLFLCSYFTQVETAPVLELASSPTNIF